jgi:hypothetical protein
MTLPTNIREAGVSHLIKLQLLAALFALGGCGAAPVAGGTKGKLQAATGGLGDVQVSAHPMDGGSWHPLGFGVTDDDGKFALVQNGAQGPLWLSPGEYRCTLHVAVKRKEDVLELKTREFSLQE